MTAQKPGEGILTHRGIENAGETNALWPQDLEAACFRLPATGSKRSRKYMAIHKPTEFSLLLRRLRERSQKSRYKLAQFTGANEAYSHRLGTGERQNPSREMVMKLALVADFSSVALEDVNELLLSAGYAPLLSRGESIPRR